MNITRTIKNNRELIFTWAKFNLQGNYIATRVGVLWIVIQPIYYTLVYTFAFKILLGKTPRGEVPFVLFFLVGTTTWSLFQKNWLESPFSIVRNINLLSQISLDAEVIVLTRLLESLFEFGVNFLVLIAATMLLGFYPTVEYVFLPLVLFFILVMILGGMFLFSSLSVFIRDIPRLVSLGLQVLFFVSGVIITTDMLPDTYAVVLKINPILHMIESLREIMIYHQAPSLESLVYMGAFSFMIFLIGYGYFRYQKGVFVDHQ